jgi:hypothetical protein
LRGLFFLHYGFRFRIGLHLHEDVAGAHLRRADEFVRVLLVEVLRVLVCNAPVLVTSGFQPVVLLERGTNVLAQLFDRLTARLDLLFTSASEPGLR